MSYEETCESIEKDKEEVLKPLYEVLGGTNW